MHNIKKNEKAKATRNKKINCQKFYPLESFGRIKLGLKSFSLKKLITVNSRTGIIIIPINNPTFCL